VTAGYLLALLVAIPAGFLIGMSPLMSRALDPFIQVLKPISPLAWMRLRFTPSRFGALVDLRDLHLLALAMLINTAFRRCGRAQGMAQRRAHARGRHVPARLHHHPARRRPTILTGMRISIGIAWLVIVAAEMLVGGTGIGYFVWNEWNNLSITKLITAILVIGIVGMILDQLLARATRLVTFPSEAVMMSRNLNPSP